MVNTSAAPRTFLSAQDTLAASLPGYTRRPQQEALAQVIEQAIGADGPVVLAAEAGTGTGKSLAYLIPAILSGKSVVVATSTKALQDQLASKDLPFLQEHLGVDFTWAVLKGRANYVCLGQMAALENAGGIDGDLAASVQMELDGWEGHSGDLADFQRDFQPADRAKLTVSANDCVGKNDCPFADKCYSEKARNAAAVAQVKIVNTSLLMIDLIVRKSSRGAVQLLGEYDLVIIDEAQELLDVATSSLGTELRLSSIERLASRAEAFSGGDGATVQMRARRLWKELDDLLAGKKQDEIHHRWAADREEIITDLISDLSWLRKSVKDTETLGISQLRFAKAKLLRQLDGLDESLRSFLLGTGYARWAEKEMFRRQERIIVKMAPVDIAPFMQAMLWSQFSSILVSATLSVRTDRGHDFSYLCDSLGLQDPRTFVTPSPFDFSTQARLFIPPASAPDPKKSPEAWRSWAQETMIQMVRSNTGGALLLFTSTSAMKEAHAALSDRLRSDGRTVMLQGERDNKVTAAAFKADTTSVLFALKSFFVGVDFQGATCSLVVVDKLPFTPPTDILFKARCKMIVARYGKGADFGRLSIPVMAMVLIQGLGRLIRHMDDFGVMACLDTRLASTGYGKRIATALPPAPRISTIAEVADFFASRG